MRRILFVDDEPNILHGLGRMLHGMRGDWDMAFAESGPEALAYLADAPFDVIVTDMRMPGMDGAQLLEEVAARHPRVVRIVLSGQCNEATVFRLVKVTHQYLSKPCDPAALKATVARACALRDVLNHDALVRLVAQCDTLPSVPEVYTRLVEELRSEEASLARVGEIVSADVAMTAKVLQLVNSAFFSLPAEITSAQRAVGLLGLHTIKALVLTVGVFSQFEATAAGALRIDELVSHSMATGALARTIAADLGQTESEEDAAFLSGVMHDVGKLVLAAALPDRYAESVSGNVGPAYLRWKAERDAFGASHAEVGAYLVGLWGLPDSVMEALAFHHRPARCPHSNRSPLRAVHLADSLAHEAGDDGPARDALRQYLDGLGFGRRLNAWRQAAWRMQHEGSAA